LLPILLSVTAGSTDVVGLLDQHCAGQPAACTSRRLWARSASRDNRRCDQGPDLSSIGLAWFTNRHVINGESNVNVVTSDGTSFEATVVGAADLTDIALLRIPLSNSATYIARFGDSDALWVGDTVFAIGNPLGLTGTVTVGIVSGLNRNVMESPFDDYIQTDAAINHGNSGGPLVNTRGEVVGMNSVIFTPGSYGGSIGLGFAIPSNILRFVADQLGQYGRVMPGWIGAHVGEFNVDTMRLAIDGGGRMGSAVVLFAQTTRRSRSDADIPVVRRGDCGRIVPFLIARQYLFLATVEGIVKTDTVFLLISGRWAVPIC
jgi:Trypsin-like peptidase domain